jgi:ABC-type sugar transport system permease subunit
MARSASVTQSPSWTIPRVRTHVRLRPRGGWFPYLVVGPALGWFGLFVFYPVAMAVWTSLHAWIVEDPAASPWVGLKNYQDLFAETSIFPDAVRNTLIYVVLRTGVLVPLGLALALLLSQFNRSQRFYIFAIFLPGLVSAAAVGVLFRLIYQPTFGLINPILLNLGLPRMGFLNDPDQALYSVIAVDIWQSVGFGTIIYLAGLLNIPETFIEAALLDGANRWQLFWQIKRPLLAHTTLFVAVITLISSFQVFDLILSMTGPPPGGPGYSTYTVSFLIYNQAMQRSQMGTGTAIAVIMYLVIMVFTLIQIRWLRPRWEF